MINQFKLIKRKLPKNTLLLLRSGSTYYSFENDALEISRATDISTTKQGNVFVCRVPSKSIKSVIEKCREKGLTIALTEA